jgi:hypothetical protein
MADLNRSRGALASVLSASSRSFNTHALDRAFSRAMYAATASASVAAKGRAAEIAESCIRKAVIARGFSPGTVGLAGTKAVNDAASRWADFAFDYGD